MMMKKDKIYAFQLKMKLQTSFRHLLHFSQIFAVSAFLNMDIHNVYSKSYAKIPFRFWFSMFIITVSCYISSAICVLYSNVHADIIPFVLSFLMLVAMVFIIRGRRNFAHMLEEIDRLRCLTNNDHKIITSVGIFALLYAAAYILIAHIIYSYVEKPVCEAATHCEEIFSSNTGLKTFMKLLVSFYRRLTLTIDIAYPTIFIVLYTSVCYIVKKAFHNLSDCFRNVILMQDFYVLINSSCKLANTANTFSKSMSYTLFFVLSYVTTLCYYRVIRIYIWKQTHTLDIILTVLIVGVGFIPLLVALCVVATCTTEAAKETKAAIQDCLVGHFSHCKKIKVNYMLQKIELDFVVCKVFKLDISLIFVILGTSLTYGVLFATLANSAS